MKQVESPDPKCTMISRIRNEFMLSLDEIVCEILTLSPEDEAVTSKGTVNMKF
ncbi:TPA: hypothetical protein HA338_15785 [Methanosarcina acetivorans]|uniref:Uncharacterized protein n=1 Tax=Methanosarcina acetivorans TaxID=2214 RepID=A0A832SGE2_9EURY|nr:hypothetical protein [Methanosarcina acetivorans]HIH95416.1 hypothetical protein [Methanosarcina acetivorans]